MREEDTKSNRNVFTTRLAFPSFFVAIFRFKVSSLYLNLHETHERKKYDNFFLNVLKANRTERDETTIQRDPT